MATRLNLPAQARIEYLLTRPASPDGLAAEVRRGLAQTPKSLPSKLFYDDAGSALFAQIMRIPEYYPAPAEQEILTDNAPRIAAQMPALPFILLDLGSGDGSKTRLLIDELLRQGRTFRYVPIDISPAAVQAQVERLAQARPTLPIHGIVGDFFAALSGVRRAYPQTPIFALFLGSNIGNFDQTQALVFLRTLYNLLAKGDCLLCGFDLQKDPAVIRRAYDDPAGLTALFNYNLLLRLNRELGGDFDLAKFVHYATYEPLPGVARSFLLATEAQTVHLAALNATVQLDAWEPIHTENSFKYTLPGLAQLASQTGFAVVEHLFDRRRYFTDAIWQRT